MGQAGKEGPAGGRGPEHPGKLPGQDNGFSGIIWYSEVNEMTDNALITVASDLSFMPIMDIAVAMQRREQVIKFTKAIMVQGTDFGIIPGTDKPTLLKPGAEKLTTFFGLAKRFQIIERVEDWTGQDHSGEPFFYYLYRCGLYRGEMLIAEADGSCSSFESKYRWRKSERVCPNCGKANIRKSKQGGGWYCWQKTDGCGATFKAGDQAIEGQEVGRVPNPDVVDQVNTVQKMAQKRALVAATLLAVNASEFFTQDLEDYIEGDFTPAPPPPAPEPVKPESKSDSRPVKPVNGDTPSPDKLLKAANVQTGGYYQNVNHLFNALKTEIDGFAWPAVTNKAAWDKAQAAAVDHFMKQKPAEPKQDEIPF